MFYSTQLRDLLGFFCDWLQFLNNVITKIKMIYLVFQFSSSTEDKRNT